MPKFHNTSAGDGTGRNSDGVHRAVFDPVSLNDLITEPERYERDHALEGYFAAMPGGTRRPANDNRRVYRRVRSSKPYDNICSTQFRYVDVSVPRVSILEAA